jgi:hypothetical protein
MKIDILVAIVSAKIFIKSSRVLDHLAADQEGVDVHFYAGCSVFPREHVDSARVQLGQGKR